jgi:hypothetical protein
VRKRLILKDRKLERGLSRHTGHILTDYGRHATGEAGAGNVSKRLAGKGKREQAPALHAQLSTAISVAYDREKSRSISMELLDAPQNHMP